MFFIKILNLTLTFLSFSAKGTLTSLLNNLLKLQEQLLTTNEETENLLTEGSLDENEKPKSNFFTFFNTKS